MHTAALLQVSFTAQSCGRLQLLFEVELELGR
jgi:hypothetical protein